MNCVYRYRQRHTQDHIETWRRMVEARIKLIEDKGIYSKIEYISTIPKQKLEG